MSVFRGTIVDSPSRDGLRIRVDHVLVVDLEGNIAQISPAHETDAALLSKAVVLPPHSFLLPTFSDLHLHAPQYLNAGVGLDLPLMEWLDTYTYPSEERIDADPELARRVYGTLVQRLREAGTGCVVAFGTIGVQANLILAKAFQDAGIRGFIGKLSMDQSPRETYGEASLEVSLSSLTTFLDEMDALVAPLLPHQRLVRPILTPRFVPTCSDELLSALSSIARERNVKVQSHMCESRDQMAWVESTRGRRDEDVFDSAGLLTEDTVQAHVTSLTPELVKLVKARGVTVAHCPLSNAYFSDAAFPLREAMDAELKVGLGSDISGGYALSIQTAMRTAVVVARLREGAHREAGGKEDGGGLKVHWHEALYLATRGGKAALGFGGAFEIGMEFDVQQILLARDGDAVAPLDLFDLPPTPDAKWWTGAVERWWCNGDDRNRMAMWVQGKQLY